MEKFMIGFAIGLGVISLLGMVVLAFFAIKNHNTFIKQTSITRAIYNYKVEQINAGLPHNDVDYSDIEAYEKTLFRFWDWSNKRILPKEKYEIIKEYL